jgi:membrane protein DedA with SNARE-associated domain
VSGLSQLQPDSLLSYLVAFLFPLLDAMAPIFPSETAVVALGVATAGSLDPRLLLLVTLAAVGAFVGDNLCYVIGRHFGPRVERRFFASERGAEQLAWAEKTLHRFGARLIIICRFIPGGRTVVTFTCGAVGYPWHRFAGVTAISGAIWATYAFVIGRVGGTTFSDKPWLGLVVALGLAFAVSLIVEAVRRLIRWRRHSLAPRPIRSDVGERRSSSDSEKARHDVDHDRDDHRPEQIRDQGVAEGGPTDRLRREVGV